MAIWSHWSLVPPKTFYRIGPWLLTLSRTPSGSADVAPSSMFKLVLETGSKVDRLIGSVMLALIPTGGTFASQVGGSGNRGRSVFS